MTTLENAINDSRVTGTTAAEKLAALLADVPGSGDSTPYTWAGVGVQLLANGVTPEQLVAFYSGIASLPGGSVLDKCLSSGGFDFADPTNRAIIHSFEINEPDWAVAILEAMLAIGADKKLWQVIGLSEEPTEQQVSDAMAKNAVVQWWAQVANELVGPLITAGKSVSEIKSAIAGS